MEDFQQSRFSQNPYKINLSNQVMKKRKTKKSCDTSSCSAPWGGAYGLGFIGAAIYYIGASTSFWMGVLGVLKALIWPLFLVFEILKYIGA